MAAPRARYPGRGSARGGPTAGRAVREARALCELNQSRPRSSARIEELGGAFTEQTVIFGGTRCPDHAVPYSPHAVSSRYRDMAARLVIGTHIHALRHYWATEILTAGVDLETVAGRLGHGGGGSTTLKVYAAWVVALVLFVASPAGQELPDAVAQFLSTIDAAGDVG